VILEGAESWISARVEVAGAIEILRVRPWATVLRVPTRAGDTWFKACAPVQSFEPRLSAELYARWPDRVARVLAHDVERRWLLLADAGARLRELADKTPVWLRVLPRYAELQRGEACFADDHLAHGVPDMRLSVLTARYAQLLAADLPLEADEVQRLRAFEACFGYLCAELAQHGVPETIQHDDLHTSNLFQWGRQVRVLDWGDASIGHPFFSLVVTFRMLEEVDALDPADPRFARLRDAYLEPWGPGLQATFELALRIGAFAHACAWRRQRAALPLDALPEFDRWFAVILRRALARIDA
jgi:phosphotransferase family enzyme